MRVPTAIVLSVGMLHCSQPAQDAAIQPGPTLSGVTLAATVSSAVSTAVPSASDAAPALTSSQAIAALGHRTPKAWGLKLPGVVRRLPKSTKERMALTLDACGGPGGDGYDAELIALLKRESIPATLFFAVRWIEAHPRVAEKLAKDPLFEIENHGTLHKPCSVNGRGAFGIMGTKTVDAARAEIVGGRQKIAALTGRTPVFFRPGTGYFDDVCVDLVRELGARPMGFTVGGDAGGGFSRGQVKRALIEAPDGSIVLLHMNRPRGPTAEGLADALGPLRERGVQFVRLSDAF